MFSLAAGSPEQVLDGLGDHTRRQEGADLWS